jgi:SAM-dependent methyltransferase
MKESYLTDKKYSKFGDMGRYFITKAIIEFGAGVGHGTKVLDVGAGEAPYRDIFNNCEYHTLDLGVGESEWDYSELTYKASVYDMPIENNTYDYVLASQLFEHLAEPKEAMKEVYRILKPGGELFITVPFHQNEHQTPHDYYRYTSFGLKYILKESGFENMEIKPMGGRYTRWAIETPNIGSFLPRLRRNGKFYWLGVALIPVKIIMKAFVLLTQVFFLTIDKFDYKQNDTFNWVVKATK